MWKDTVVCLLQYPGVLQYRFLHLCGVYHDRTNRSFSSVVKIFSRGIETAVFIYLCGPCTKKKNFSPCFCELSLSLRQVSFQRGLWKLLFCVSL